MRAFSVFTGNGIYGYQVISESSEFKVVSVRPSVRRPSVRPSVRPSDVRKILCNELVLGFQPIDLKPYGIDYIYIEDVHLPF